MLHNFAITLREHSSGMKNNIVGTFLLLFRSGTLYQFIHTHAHADTLAHIHTQSLFAQIGTFFQLSSNTLMQNPSGNESKLSQ